MKERHGLSYTRTYNIWQKMLGRCNNPKDPRYHRYGGRGIKVCERWHKFSAFYRDVGEIPDGFTFDRIDNDKGYEPGNTQFSTIAQQTRNTSRNIRFNGICASEASRLLGGDRTLVSHRIADGWTIKDAFTQKAH